MRIYILALIILFFNSCTNHEMKETKQTSRNEKLCFLITQGLQNEDSTYLHIQIEDTLVTGIYNDIPYEKDASIGTINGTVKDSIINCVYTYTQEGIESTENQVWKLNGDHILLRTAPASYDEQGNILYDSSKFEFNFRLNKVSCN